MGYSHIGNSLLTSQVADNKVKIGDISSLQKNTDFNIINISLELETIKNATLTGVNTNIYIEKFLSLDNINLTHGNYEAVNQRLILM